MGAIKTTIYLKIGRGLSIADHHHWALKLQLISGIQRFIVFGEFLSGHLFHPLGINIDKNVKPLRFCWLFSIQIVGGINCKVKHAGTQCCDQRTKICSKFHHNLWRRGKQYWSCHQNISAIHMAGFWCIIKVYILEINFYVSKGLGEIALCLSKWTLMREPAKCIIFSLN